MQLSVHFVRIAALGFFASLLAACGGGGGGDDNRFLVQLQTSSVTFGFTKGDPVTSQTITATWRGEPPSALYILATLEGTGIDSSIPILIQSASAVATVRPLSNLNTGTYTGRIIFSVCSDPACSQRIGGTPLAVPFTINVAQPAFDVASSIQFQYIYGTTPGGAVQVPISAAAGSWTATASDPWIVLSKAAGTGADSVTINYNPLAVTAPTSLNTSVNGTVRFTAGAIQKTVSVALSVIKPTIQFNVMQLLSGVNGATIPSVPMSISLNVFTSLPLSITSNVPWLKFTPAGTATPQTITVSVDPTMGPLASGTHTGQLHLVAGNGTNNVFTDVPFTLTLTKAQFTVPAITLGGTAGRTFDGVPFTLSLNTGPNQFPWTVSGLPSWASIDRTSGTATSTAQTLTLTPNRLNSIPGTAQTTIRFTATINGDTVVSDVPVSFNLDTHKLIASENGVALVTTPDPTWRRLAHTIKIRDNLGLSVPWTATSSDSWLTVTPSGTSGGDLTLTANPASLTMTDHLYTATITVSSSDTSIAGTERIRVGLWVGASTVATRQSIWDGFPTQAAYYGSPIVADPIRPYVYMYVGTDIRVFNLYTQSVVATIPSVYSGGISNPGSGDFQALAVSSDGDRLYAYDKQDGVIVPINLTTLTMMPSYPVNNSYSGNVINEIKYVRANGVGLIMGPEKAYLADVGTAYDSGLLTMVGAPGDAKYVFQGNYRYDVDYTSAGGNTFIRSNTPGYVDVSSVIPSCCYFMQTVSDADGSHVYAAEGRNVVRYDGRTMTLLSTQIYESGANFWNVAVGGDGIVAASAGSISTGFDVFVYAPSGALLTSFRADQLESVSSVPRRSLIVSSDGFLVAAGTQSRTFEIVPVH